MAKTDNLTDFLTDVADAIRRKKGKSAKINPQNFASEIASIETGGGGDVPDTPVSPSLPSWTGHADAEGLRAIGWTDEDIEYYQQNGVNWNEEDDQCHKVTDDNKALYGVLTADNISTYKDRIVYLPKIDTSAKTSSSYMFHDCKSLIAIPHLDMQNVTYMGYMFYNCYSLVSIPPLDMQKVKNATNMFNRCYSLTSIPQMDTGSVVNMSRMFYYCYSLTSIPLMNTSKATDMSDMFYFCYSLTSIPHLDMQNVTTAYNMFYNCYSLASIPPLDMQKVTSANKMFYQCYSLVSVPSLNMQALTNTASMFYRCYSLISVSAFNMQNATSIGSMFNDCNSLTYANLVGLKKDISFEFSFLLSKESLLFIINNEASTSAFAIYLKAYAYNKLANDADVAAALEAHPNVSLTSVS